MACGWSPEHKMVRQSLGVTILAKHTVMVIATDDLAFDFVPHQQVAVSHAEQDRSVSVGKDSIGYLLTAVDGRFFVGSVDLFYFSLVVHLLDTHQMGPTTRLGHQSMRTRGIDIQVQSVRNG